MTARTSSRRERSLSDAGIWEGIPAVAILRLALTIRFATVGSGTRKARAISSVVRPTTARRVRAICASRRSAGWQQVKIRRNRSSGSRSGVSGRAASWASFSRYRASRRRRSRPRRRAVVSSQAPGRSGIPSSGQCSRASTTASDTSSSARSKSPSWRTRLVVSRPASSRKTRSSSGWVSAAASALDDRSDLHLAIGRGQRPDDGDGLVEVGAVDDAVAADRLLGLQQRTVDEGGLAALQHHGGGGVGRLQLVTGDHLALGGEAAPPLADGGEDLVPVISDPFSCQAPRVSKSMYFMG